MLKYINHVEQGYEVRDAESLRAKFKTLCLVKNPTGDPICPPNVVRAKRLMSAIENKMGVTDFDDEPLLNDNEPTKSSKKFIELDGNSSDSSDDNDLELELPNDTSPIVQVTTSSSSSSTTPSTTSNAIGYKRVGVSETDARKHSINLQTKQEECWKNNLRIGKLKATSVKIPLKNI